MSSPVVDRSLSRASLTLTIKVDGAPAVHFTYDHTRPFEQASVTVLDQITSAPWSFEVVVLQASAFLFNYWIDRDKWPAELRAPCAGRTKGGET
ncbi:MAG TPA: hypothetical protein VKF37_13200 [Chloroflexota bacterium]|nr:hypothetical protein [Chloroflexota bacterium]